MKMFFEASILEFASRVGPYFLDLCLSRIFAQLSRQFQIVCFDFYYHWRATHIIGSNTPYLVAEILDFILSPFSDTAFFSA